MHVCICARVLQSCFYIITLRFCSGGSVATKQRPLFCSKRHAVDYKGVSVCFLISYSNPQGTEARRVERAEAEEEEEEQGDN